MKHVLWTITATMVSTLTFGTTAVAGTDTFDSAQVDTPPGGWTCGVTGSGAPKWTIEADASAPSPPNVLKQSGSGTFPWCVKNGSSITDGFVEVKFKPIAGREDRAGGVVWRWKNGDNYYIARANALEGNVSLYHTEGGRRITIKYVGAAVAANVWHTLRVQFAARHIKVIFDRKPAIELDDGHITGAGAVGVWTKADSVTAFDDFAFGGQ
jgi:hypothetical protein